VPLPLEDVIELYQGTVTGAPTAGTFAAGALHMDSAGDLFSCTVGGTPGTWRQLTGLPVPPRSWWYNSATQAVSTTVATATINTLGFTNDAAHYVLAAGQITVLTAGDYELSFGFGFTASNNSRATAWLEVDGVEIPGTRVYIGCTANGVTGSATCACITRTLAAGAVVRLRLQTASGGGNTIAQSVRVSINEVR
jgi:hypothetical protein